MSRISLHLELPDRQPPSEFRIFRAGINSSAKGDFLFDDVAAVSVMAAARHHGIDFAIDFDHHTLSTASGVRAIAAGWFQLEMRGNELWAKGVKWTPEAEEYLRSASYRFFSPLFDCDPATNRITSLINCALTNTPALHDLPALVAASALHEPARYAPTPLSTETREIIRRLGITEAEWQADSSRRLALSFASLPKT